MEGTRDRFKEAPWFDIASNISVALGGLGGIGSWTAFLLGRLGVSTRAYDFDSVEAHNIGGQLFPVNAVNLSKTCAFDMVNRSFNVTEDGNTLNTVNKRMTGGCASYVTITAFDNMASRRNIFVGWVKLRNYIIRYRQKNNLSDPDNPMPFFLYIDGRMTAEFGQVFAVPGNVPEKEFNKRKRKYLDSLFSDDKIPDEPCTFRATSHNAAMIASIITSVLINGYMNYRAGEEVREVPVKTEYGLPFIYFNKYML